MAQISALSGVAALKRNAISATAGLAVISLGLLRASHIKKGCGLLGPDAMPRRYVGKRIGGSPGSPLGQGMRLTANGRTPNRAGNDSLMAPPVARVVLPCTVNERLRSDWGADFLLTRNEDPARGITRRAGFSFRVM